MAAMAMTHATHAVYKSFAGFTARSTSDTLHRTRVALAKTSGVLAMNALSMQRGLV